jgi:hypothetical protein
MKVAVRISVVIFLLAGAPAAFGTALASVDGKTITEADVTAALGYVPSGPALRETVDGLVEREIVLALAKRKGLGATSDEVTRAAALAARAHLPGFSLSSESYRRRLAEEITISKYIDLYVYPRIQADEESLQDYFIKNASRFVKRPPADKAALKKLFPPRRNEVLYRYVKSRIKKILAESAHDARGELGVEVYI